MIEATSVESSTDKEPVPSMFAFVQSVMLATYYEHQRATGHDAFSIRHHLSVAGIKCNVCLHLGAARRDMDRIEEGRRWTVGK
mgnify:FL=1